MTTEQNVPDFESLAATCKALSHPARLEILQTLALREMVRQKVAEAYAGCVAGAVPKDDYLELIQETGFSNITVATERRIDVPAELIAKSLTREQQEHAEDRDLHVMSVTVTAIKR